MADPIDWMLLAKRLQAAQVQLTHGEGEQRLYGLEYVAESLRRAFDFSPGDGSDGRRALPHETVGNFLGLMTAAEADHLREGHTVMDRARAERAEARVKELYEENRRVIRDAARDLAKLIRKWCNEVRVPSKYRREGVLLAADWIDPDSEVRP